MNFLLNQIFNSNLYCFRLDRLYFEDTVSTKVVRTTHSSELCFLRLLLKRKKELVKNCNAIALKIQKHFLTFLVSF